MEVPSAGWSWAAEETESGGAADMARGHEGDGLLGGGY